MAFFETTRLKNQEGTVISPATEDTLSLLKRIFYLLKPLGQITGGGSNRLSIDINNITGGTIGTVTTVTTCSTVTNLANLGSVAAFDLMKSASRTAYNTGIRSKLS